MGWPHVPFSWLMNKKITTKSCNQFSFPWKSSFCICASVNEATIGSDNGLFPGQCQVTIWTNDGLFFIGCMKTIISNIRIEIKHFIQEIWFQNLHNGYQFVSASMCWYPPWSHLGPCQPLWQVHSDELPTMLHLPPLRQGMPAHGL